MSKRVLLSAVSVFALAPSLASACACGCGVFDVGTSTMMPTEAGGTAWFEYDFMNQTTNWSGSSDAPRANNGDKVLRSDFFQAGTQYMFNRSWGVMGEMPLTDRFFKTTDDSGNLVKSQHAAIGDLHLQGVYSGFSDDMSTGITFGLKLPTGDFRYSGFDRDTSIGSGSTDLLLGAYHMGEVSKDYALNWFANVQWDHAFMSQGDYRPGDETDSAIGVYHDAGMIGSGHISPLLQLIGSYRVHDTGLNADPPNSGYKRLLISPGVEYDVNAVKIYGDVELPVYQYTNGNQLVAPVLLKFIVGYNF